MGGRARLRKALSSSSKLLRIHRDSRLKKISKLAPAQVGERRAKAWALLAARLGLGRIATLYCRSSTSYQICEHIWCLYI
jgi:hypothetical protein